MKIIVRTKEKAPAVAARRPALRQDFRPHRHRRHPLAAPNCGIPPEMLGQLLTSLRDFARTHPGWLLVDITTHKGDIVKITL